MLSPETLSHPHRTQECVMAVMMMQSGGRNIKVAYTPTHAIHVFILPCYTPTHVPEYNVAVHCSR